MNNFNYHIIIILIFFLIFHVLLSFLGAGRFPTANSVMNDLIRLSVDKSSPPFPLSCEVVVNPDYVGTFYIRIKSMNSIGKFIMMLIYCGLVNCAVLYCAVMCCYALCRAVLWWTVRYCTVVNCAMMFCGELCYAVLCCDE